MNSRVVLSLLVCWTTSSAAAASAEDDLKKLQGTWKVTKTERRGKPLEEAGKLMLVLKGDQVSIKHVDMKDEDDTTTFKIDPSKNPKTMDFADPEKPERNSRIGIYSIEGDTLKLCFGRPDRDRPNDFATKADSPFGFLIVCTRSKEQSP